MLNLKFALRTLFKTPFVTTVAVLSLAFGIGANTAIFSLFNQMLLKPLPVSAPDELVNLLGVPPIFLTPYRQDERIGFISFYVRTDASPEGFLRRVPQIVASLDRDLPVEELRTMPQQIRENVFLDRMISTMSAAFAALATILAAIGLYGVLAYTVTQRTREFGLRMALGADGANVRRLVLRQVGVLALIGGVIGLALGVGIGRVAEQEEQLFEVSGTDPVVFASAFVLLGVVALLAGFVPAHRASKVHPMRALRWE